MVDEFEKDSILQWYEWIEEQLLDVMEASARTR
jgi:hypothetical protein